MVNMRPNRGLDPGATAIWEKKLFKERRGRERLKKRLENRKNIYKKRRMR